MATEAEAQVLERSEPDADAPLPAATPRSGYLTGYGVHLDEAAIIRDMVPLVKRLALRVKARMPETVQLDDLIQAGLIAVLRLARQSGAVPAIGPPLQRSIVNAMIDEARREVWAPVRTVRLAKAAGEAMRVVKFRLGRDGSDEEVAAEMGIPLADYHTVLVDIAGIRLLQIDEVDESVDERMHAADDQDAALDRTRMISAMVEAITELPEREKLVLSLYYEQELNMEEVGAVLGLDKSTVCRVHGRALLLLRGVLADWRGDGGPATSESGD